MKEYVDGFIQDYEFGKIGEQITAKIFNLMGGKTYSFTMVGHLYEYRHIGDIICRNKLTNKETIIEVKNDTRIGTTGNVLCEIDNYYFDSGEHRKGNIYNPSDIYVVVSRDTHTLFVFNQEKLRQIMTRCRLINIPHQDQITTGFLVPVELAQEEGALITTVDFADLDWCGWL